VVSQNATVSKHRYAFLSLSLTLAGPRLVSYAIAEVQLELAGPSL